MAWLKGGKYSEIFLSKPEYLEKVESITSSIAREAGFNESSSDDLSIAITELFNNAIHHGNRNDPNKKIFLKYEFDGRRLKITVEDEGNGFNPKTIKNPLAPENLLSDSGRGIYLVKMLMDGLDFKFDKNRSRVIIIKKI